MKVLDPFKNIFILALCLLIQGVVDAQTLSFKVIRSDTWKAIDHVTIQSSSHGSFYSDANGAFQIAYDDHDTLTLSKENFHTIHYVIEAKNFDTSHTISLTMTPLNKGEQPITTSEINNLQKFDYHFVHDNPEKDSYLKVHAMESVPENQTREGYEKEFKIGSIPLDHTTVEHKSNTKSSYQLKKGTK